MNRGRLASSQSPMNGIGATLKPLDQELRQDRDEREVDRARPA